MRVPSTANERARTLDGLLFKANSSRSEPRCQIRTVPSTLPEAIKLPSLLNAIALTTALCRRSVRESFHFLTSLNRISLPVAEARNSPLLLTARTSTSAAWSSKECNCLPVFKSQTRIVLSELPETSQSPPGLKASEVIEPV